MKKTLVVLKMLAKKILPTNYYIKDVFKAKKDKKVLLSYILKPFRKGVGLNHTNERECMIAAEVFHHLGYSVDVIDFRVKKIPKKLNGYTIVYGFGEPLEFIIKNDIYRDVTTIFYGSGCHPWFSNENSTKQLIKFYSKKGVFLPESGRLIEESRVFQLIAPTAIIALGNDYVKSTYENYSTIPKIFNLNAFFNKVEQQNIVKSNNAKKRFLWFGSTGLIHKGLDLLLDVFKDKSDLFLHICGNFENESRFWDIYKEEIERQSNIIIEGFVRIGSERFNWLMENCGFVIHPSVSEGGAPSVLTVMGNGGVIPIVTEMCGIDVEQYGYILKETEKNSIVDAINWTINLTDEDFRNKSDTIKREISTKYSIDKYTSNLKKILKEII